MALSVSTNTASLVAQTNLAKSQNRLNVSLQRLSTGFKVNGASDNPAASVSSQLQKAQIAGLTKSINNIERGKALAQTAENGLNEIGSILLKMRDLAADSANSATQDTAALTANQTELDALAASITRISDTTKFGTKALLDGTFSAAQFQVGANSAETASLTIANADATTLAVGSLSITSATTANAALTAIDAAISTVATAAGNVGAFRTGTLDATQTNNRSQLDNLKAAQSVLVDTDYQEEIANFTTEQIRQQAATTVLGLSNRGAQSILSLLNG
ncbi:MAG: flagellin FliC [Planctomycetes bacterium]|nr:flagellin FliC [Planctomycetota bacterium]